MALTISINDQAAFAVTIGVPGPQGIQGIQGIQGPVGPSGVSSWGGITGTLSNQTDLQSALDGKYSTSNPSGFVDGPYVSAALVGYASQSWVIGQNYLTESSLSGYATQAWVTNELTPYATQTYVNSLGFITASALSPYLLSSDAASTYQTISGMSSYAPKASPTFTGTVTIPAGASISGYLTTATAASTYLTIASASSTYAPKVNPTFTGTVTIPTPATSSNTTVAASTAFVKAQGYATLASPTFTGTVTIPSGASISGYLTTSSAALTYAVTARGLPASGTTGQILAKNSGTSYDVSWTTFVPGDRYLTTSTTSNSIANGAKTFTVGTGLSYTPTQDCTIAYDAAHHMHATVTTYNSSTGVLVVDVNQHSGTGTYTAWTVNVGGAVPAQSVTWGDIVGTLGDQTDLATALNAKLASADAASTYLTISNASSTYASIGYVSTTFFPIAGGALSLNSQITVADTSDSDSEMAGFGFGVQKSSDNTKGSTLQFDGLDTYDGGNHMKVNPTGLVFPDATTQTTSATNLGYISQGTADGLYYSISNPNGFTNNTFDGTSAIQAVANGYASTVTSYPSSGQYLKYNGMSLEWDTPGGGGGGTAWGAITGTLSDQTDLNSALGDKYPTSNPSGFTSYTDSNAISAISGGVTSSISGYPSSGNVLGYNGSQITWVSNGSPYYNSVWAYGNWYSANVTGIYDGYMNYYTVLTF